MIATSIPVCDIAALRDGSARLRARVVLDIGAAARTAGFFTIVNHGIPELLTQQAFAAAQRFFALPSEEKDRISMDGTPSYRGYSRQGGMRHDRNVRADHRGVVRESFNVGRELAPDDPDLAAGTPFVGFNRWPQLPGFRATAMSYFQAMNGLAMDLQRAFALDLGMPPDFFTRYSDRPLTTLRFSRFPSQSGLGDATSSGEAHHDWGIFTLLAQDDVGRLEIARRDGSWLAVEPVPNALVCNIGDCLMRWSNDRYASRPHRVVNRSGRPRHSIAFFADPNPDTLIACLPTCQDEDDPAKYAPISYAAYQQERYAATAVATAV